jgi:hypothetical protein
MRSHWQTTFCTFTVSLLTTVSMAGAAEILPSDQEMTVGGVAVACTGVGDEAKEDARWPSYATRIEFANSRAEYVTDLDISIRTARGVTLMTVRCESPWFLAKLQPGRYSVVATYDGGLTKTVHFTAGTHGQVRTIVRFPELGALRADR